MQNVVILIVSLFCTINISHGFIVPKLLLPYYDQIKVNYTIYAEEGCYKWRSLNPRIASVVPVNDGHQSECSQSAVVYVESTSPSRKTTLLLAESELTGTILQCDIIIDRIHAIDIISRTRELYLEDPPETLKIRALDSEDNTFSSTAGMTFDWSLLQDYEHESDQAIMPAHTILSIIKFIDTMYNSEWYVEQLEKEGKQPDTILVSGLQTGTAYVSAKLTSMTDIRSTKIKLTVRDKVFLNPSGDVWIPQYASIKYWVEQWRKGRPTQIKMPSPQYFLRLTNDEDHIVTLDQQTSTVVGQKIGHCQIRLMDRNLKQHHTLQAYSDIYVSEPAYLKFSILPDNKWVLETGRNYILLIQVFDNDNHLLWSSSNLRIVADIRDSNFKVLDSSTNGTWYNIDAIKAGTPELYAKLNGIIRQDGTTKQYQPVIEATQLVEIYNPITVNPPIVVFPWQPEPVLYKYQLVAEGGSGNYSWSIDDSQVAVVTNVGMVMTKMNGEYSNKPYSTGSTIVRASDIKNSAHWGSSEVWVLPVANILFVKSKREAEIGTSLDLFLMMNAQVRKELVPVVDCRDSKIKWTVEDPTVFSIIDGYQYSREDLATAEFACTGKRLKALREGYTTLTASYVQTDIDGKTRKFQSTVTIAAFPALRALDPPHLAVVSLGSSKLMKFIGGPILWPLWHAGYERFGKSDDDKLIKMSLVTSFQQQHHFVITCYDLGETMITLSVFNKPCNTNPLPVQSKVVVRLSCAIPSRIEISVPVLLPACPLHNTHSVQTVSLVNGILPLNVTAFDVHGNMFDNFSSIHLDWSSDYPNTTFNEDSSFYNHLDSFDQNKHIVQQLAGLSSHEGELTINVKLTQYKNSVDSQICQLHNCKFIDEDISGSVVVLVVHEPSVSPGHLHLYNHVNSTMDIEITGGSGYFFHKIQQQHNVASVHEVKHNILKITAVNSGKGELHVIDNCLIDHTQTTTAITISQLENLHLNVVPRMELDSWSEATVKITDNFGQELPARFLSYINIKITTNPENIINSKSPYASASSNLVVLSDITARNIGTTSMTAIASTRDGRKIVSNAVRINVFPKLELIPSVITLIQHASYQLLVRGGPRSDFNIEFSLSDNAGEIANISQSGLVHGLKVGTVMASARAIMHDGTIFHCKAKTKITVVQLIGVRIVAPLSRLQVGGFASLHVTGITDDSRNPLSFGNAVPGLSFKWKVVNPAVVKLQSVHAQAGIETDDSLRFSMIAKGLSAGHSSISVTVTAADEGLHQLSKTEFFAEVAFMVFEPLKLASSPHKHWRSDNSLLITPSTSHIIQSNRDGVAQYIKYQVLASHGCSNCPQTIENSCICVDDRGFVTSQATQCDATILVTSVERFGINQTVALHVLVRPVSYVIARATTQFRVKDSTFQAFPLSSTINFVVEQFDETGEKFDASSHNTALFQNRHDLIELEPESGNRSFVVHTPLEGITVVSVACYLEDNLTPAIAFYFPIRVSHSIQPRDFPLVVGLKYCFTSVFLNNDGTDGVWTASDYSLILHKNTGSAISLSGGTADITYTVDTFKAHMQVKLKPFLAAFHQDKLPRFISSGDSQYILPITILQENKDRETCDDMLEEMDKIASRLFQCTVNFRQSSHVRLFKVRPSYIPELGSYACVLSRDASCNDDDSKIAMMDDDILVSVKETSRDVGLVSGGDVSIEFMPQFVAELSSDKLEYGSHVSLCVKSNSKVQLTLKVTAVNEQVLKIEEPTKDIYNNPCYKISIQLDDFTTLTSEVRISNTYTLQDELVQLNLVRKGAIMSQSSCLPPPPKSQWKNGDDNVMDGYLAYINTAAVVVISTAVLIVAFGFLKWVTSSAVHPSSTSFLSRTPPPYDPINSPYPSGSTTLNTSGSPGTPKMRLWSRHYETKLPGSRTG